MYVDVTYFGSACRACQDGLPYSWGFYFLLIRVDGLPYSWNFCSSLIRVGGEKLEIRGRHFLDVTAVLAAVLAKHFLLLWCLMPVGRMLNGPRIFCVAPFYLLLSGLVGLPFGFRAKQRLLQRLLNCWFAGEYVCLYVAIVLG